MIQNIASALGVGSGVDTLALVDQLVEIQSAPDTQRLDAKEELFSAQLSDYGILRSALGDLEVALDKLSNTDTFDAKSVSFPETNLLIPTEIEADALAGNYQITVGQIARSQSLGSAVFSDPSDPVGEGTLTFRFGKWDDGAVDDDATSVFTIDAEKTGATITIDASNNSLTGLRDAINEADLGAQATIINDGSEYRLLITAPSGDNNEMEIVVEESGGSPTNNDGSDLSQFSFNTTGSQLTQYQGGRNAELTINGLPVTRASNEINDVIEGLEFSVQNSSPTEVVSLAITEDKGLAEQTIRDFVEAYNTFLETVSKLTDYDEETEEYGSLRTDPLAKNMISRLRGIIGASVSGIEGGYTALTNVGVRTNLDGSIGLDEGDFSDAFENNFDLVKTLFTPRTSSDSSLITVTNSGNNSVPGTYAVNVSSEASKGELVLTTLAGPPVSFDSTGNDYTFEVTVDGVESGVISVTADTVFTPQEMAAELQSQINSDSALSETGSSVTVAWDTDHFVFTSDEFGSSSTVEITAVGANAGDLGLSEAAGTAGSNTIGTIDNVPGFGLANVLLPALGSDAEGLSMLISPGATTANISFSRGFGLEMKNIIESFLESAGLIKQREVTIRERMSDVDDDRETLKLRTEAYRARLESQFIAMERIVQNLQNTGSFFDGLADRLPFTAKR